MTAARVCRSCRPDRTKLHGTAADRPFRLEGRRERSGKQGQQRNFPRPPARARHGQAQEQRHRRQAQCCRRRRDPGKGQRRGFDPGAQRPVRELQRRVQGEVDRRPDEIQQRRQRHLQGHHGSQLERDGDQLCSLPRFDQPHGSFCLV